MTILIHLVHHLSYFWVDYSRWIVLLHDRASSLVHQIPIAERIFNCTLNLWHWHLDLSLLVHMCLVYRTFSIAFPTFWVSVSSLINVGILNFFKIYKVSQEYFLESIYVLFRHLNHSFFIILSLEEDILNSLMQLFGIVRETQIDKFHILYGSSFNCMQLWLNKK